MNFSLANLVLQSHKKTNTSHAGENKQCPSLLYPSFKRKYKTYNTSVHTTYTVVPPHPSISIKSIRLMIYNQPHVCTHLKILSGRMRLTKIHRTTNDLCADIALATSGPDKPLDTSHDKRRKITKKLNGNVRNNINRPNKTNKRYDENHVRSPDSTENGATLSIKKVFPAD